MAIIFAFVFLCMVGYAIQKYGAGDKHISTLIYFFFVSKGFYLIPDDVLSGFPISKLIDFGTVYLLYVLFAKLTHESQNIKKYLKKNKECRLFFILFLYLTIIFVYTVVTQQEVFGLSLAVYRNYFCFLSFLLFVDLNDKQQNWVFKKVFFITVFACVLYVIQPVIGVKTLTGGGIGEEGSSGLTRYRNIPYLAYFFLIYATIRLNLAKPKRVLLLFLMIISLVLTQHRGIMVGYGITISAYLVLERKFKEMAQYTIIGGIMFLMVGNLVMTRFEKADTGSDIDALLHMDYRKVDFENDDDGGTLTFRIMHLFERADYLVQNPQYALQGVGMRHEDSPNTARKFNFYICSRKMTPIGWYNQQLDTGDLVWATPLIKFGVIGLGLYVIITFSMLRFFYRERKTSEIATISLFYYVLLIITSFKNDQLFDAIHLFMIFMIYNIIKIQQKNNENIYLDFFKRR